MSESSGDRSTPMPWPEVVHFAAVEEQAGTEIQWTSQANWRSKMFFTPPEGNREIFKSVELGGIIREGLG